MEDEVNIVDYLAITANRVFVPEVYYGIRNNKEVFYKNKAKMVYIRYLGQDFLRILFVKLGKK